MVVTRFAPSPTGVLHIGGLRTALFNYLYAKKHNGKFLLRIEDTDINRSKPEFIQPILFAIKWLGIKWDDEIVYQSTRISRHIEVANMLLNQGKAYKCFVPQSTINQLREKAKENKESFIFHSPWRDKDASSHPNSPYVIRLKVPNQEIELYDTLRGVIKTDSSHIDDMILLKSDGTPTYMLAVVVDDYDMRITNIIRGDDHLTNATRQSVIYQALGWTVPTFTHIPLIHDANGNKLSKRTGASGVDVYSEDYLPSAMFNYLLRLGWSYGDREIISKDDAVSLFNLESLSKSPARLDIDKMKHVNHSYIQNSDNSELIDLIISKINLRYSNKDITNMRSLMDHFKSRSVLIRDLVKLCIPCIESNIEITIQSNDLFYISEENNQYILRSVLNCLKLSQNIDKKSINDLLKELAFKNSIKLSELMKPVRIALTGINDFPNIFYFISIISFDTIESRIKNVLF